MVSTCIAADAQRHNIAAASVCRVYIRVCYCFLYFFRGISTIFHSEMKVDLVHVIETGCD